MINNNNKTNYKGGNKGNNNNKGRDSNIKAYSLLILVIIQKEVWIYLYKE